MSNAMSYAVVRDLAGDLARTSHPEPSAAVTLIAAALAASSGRSVAGVVVVALAVGTGQLSVGWSNDYFDRVRDASSGRDDKPVALGALPARTVGVAAIVTLVACVPLSLLSGWRAATAHLIAVALAWLYNMGVKGTAASLIPFAIAYALLPAFIVLGLPGHPMPAWWLLLAGALLGCGGHFANVLPDLDEDLRAGVRGVPHRVGARWSLWLAVTLLAAASAVIAFGPGSVGPTAIAGLAVTGAAVVAVLVGATTWRPMAVTTGTSVDTAGPNSPNSPGTPDGSGRGNPTPVGRGAFRVILAVALADVALLVAAGPNLV
ncbi:UbiA family prenyltransferase [Frankia sp. Cr2]|uniref:UbiA family prenyltransferase n=1 Tax=Frankia sp. Cr2 TaxID=3073932 RepID=UPI002AD457F4|nr:UbiA family prenyltransferase [Frankia sp. Cr2]